MAPHLLPPRVTVWPCVSVYACVQVGASLRVFEMLQSGENDMLGAIRRNTTHFRSRMQEAGFQLMGNPDHPICPVWLGDAKLAASFADKMLEKGIYVIGFSHPVRCGPGQGGRPPLPRARTCAPSHALLVRRRARAQVVPQGKARIRVQLSAGHTEEQIDRAVDAFVSVGRELKVVE